MTPYNLLVQEWAYIMFILLSSVIIFTLCTYFIFFWIRTIKSCCKTDSSSVAEKDTHIEEKNQEKDLDNKYMELVDPISHTQSTEQTESEHIFPKKIDNTPGFFESLFVNIKSYFGSIKPTRVASIEQLNNPSHLVTVTRTITSQSSSSSDSSDIDCEHTTYMNKNLNELESRFKKKASRGAFGAGSTISAPADSKKNSITSHISSDISSRKSSATSDYYHHSMASLYSKQKRHSDVSSVRSNTIKVANSKRPHRHSVFTPMPTRSKGQLVSVESQLSNADSYRHVAVPLDKSFIENEVSKVDLQKYFSDTRMNQYNTKKWSIATPSSTKREFDMPLKKPRQSLPSNVPSSYSDTERKFSYDPTKTSPCNTESLTNSRMDSAYLSQMIDSGEENAAQLNVPVPPRARRASMCDPIVLEEIEKDKYKTSIEEQAFENKHSNEKIATIEFGIQYFSGTHKLVVNLLSLFDLNTSEIINQKEVFLKCSLIPNKISYDTKLFQSMQDTVLEENFEFNNLESSDLDTSFLEIELFEFDKDTKGNFLASTMVQLNYSNIEMNSILVKDLKTNSKRVQENYNGELLISLAYLPRAERLTINVRKAVNLNLISNDRCDKKSSPDPYVKVSVFEKNGRRLKKKKTSTEKSTTNPVFNQEIVFQNITKDQLESLAIDFAVYNDSMKNRELLGVVDLSAHSTGNKRLQWMNMINGKKSNAWWHNLEVHTNKQLGIENQQANKYSGVMSFYQRNKPPSLKNQEALLRRASSKKASI